MFKKKIKGVIHVGSHECEERNIYINSLNLNDKNIIWIDAIKEKVDECRKKYQEAIIFNNCISDVDDQEVQFIITNNYQSSSIFELGTHKIEYPDVFETHRILLKTKTLNTLFKENNLDVTSYNLMNIDIQGAELKALIGATNIIPYLDYLIVEVNIKQLYVNCPLLNDIDDYLKSHGFKRIYIELTKCGWGDAIYERNT